MRRTAALLTFSVILSASTLGLLWYTAVPLGVRSEWVWHRIPFDASRPLDALEACGLAAVAAGFYCWLAHAGRVAIGTASRGGQAGWLAMLVTAAFVWLFLAQEAPPREFRMSKSAFTLYFPWMSGYHVEARSAASTADYFGHYLERIQRPDDPQRVTHIGTHPPGLFLLHRGLIEFCQRFPTVSEAILTTVPNSAQAAFDFIDRTSGPALPPLRRTDRAAIWLAALLTQLTAAATVVPLYLLLRRTVSAPAAWSVVVFWPLVPALPVFLPKSDALYPFLGMLFLWLWISSMDHRSWRRALLAGLVLWLGMFLSLALLPVAGVAAVMTCRMLVRRKSPATETAASGQTSSVWAAAPLALAGFLLPCATVWYGSHLNLFEVWWQNLLNHAEFYEHYPRSWGLWILVNPVETLFAVGAPVVCLAMAGIWQTFRRDGGSSPAAIPIWACGLVWGLLWLSGKNSGEAARLWLVLFPCLIWLAGPGFDDGPASTDSVTSRAVRTWLLLLGLQAAVCLATVTRVEGLRVAP